LSESSTSRWRKSNWIEKRRQGHRRQFGINRTFRRDRKGPLDIWGGNRYGESCQVEMDSRHLAHPPLFPEHFLVSNSLITALGVLPNWLDSFNRWNRIKTAVVGLMFRGVQVTTEWDDSGRSARRLQSRDGFMDDLLNGFVGGNRGQSRLSRRGNQGIIRIQPADSLERARGPSC
jgi:hypothetical protein